MRSTRRCLLMSLLCLSVPAVSHAGPLRDALAAAGTQQANPPASKSHQRLQAGGIFLTVMGGGVMIYGATRTEPEPALFCGFAFKSDCDVVSNRAIVTTGAAMMGLGVLMVILSKKKPSPEIVATPGKLAIRHTVTF